MCCRPGPCPLLQRRCWLCSCFCVALFVALRFLLGFAFPPSRAPFALRPRWFPLSGFFGSEVSIIVCVFSVALSGWSMDSYLQSPFRDFNINCHLTNPQLTNSQIIKINLKMQITSLQPSANRGLRKYGKMNLWDASVNAIPHGGGVPAELPLWGWASFSFS